MWRTLSWIALVFLMDPPATAAQNAGSELHPIRGFSTKGSDLTITRSVRPADPFSVAGEQGAILGRQDGRFEAWIFPIKLLRNFRIEARLEDYPVPIDVNAHAASIEVSPAQTTITYSHAAFTIRQHMFAPRGNSSAAGAVVLFEITSVRPLRLDFRFMPEVVRMWPAPNFGRPSAEWVRDADGGHYILHTDNPDLLAAVGMPRTAPGILPPYQERPKNYPLELRLSFDPRKDAGLLFPLLIATGGSSESLGHQLREMNNRIPEWYVQTHDYYQHFLDNRLTCDTPDAEFDRAMRWAEVAIDQAQVRFHGETGLIAGYYESGDSARPGFAWFFGRDALWTSYAVNSYGDFALTRKVLEFLIRRQRDDGKIMHEFSQTADLVDWKSLPYFYAAADATPLFVMAMDDYLNASGDVSFLRRYWDSIKRAYAFTRSHVDKNGVYENSEGTGWVESWPQGMPHQEIYLAALDQQSAAAMARMAKLLQDGALEAAARQTAERIRESLEADFYQPQSRFYAFSRNRDGTLDTTATIFPAVAWWSGGLTLPGAGEMLSRWASHEFSTDWGLRDLSERTSFYDPISYHQGSVWPLFTGWVALAEYRAGRPLAGYQHLMQNADLTWAQDPGAVTELLSGEFFQPLGRSTSHQTWSSAMVLTPAIRGLFGLNWDAPHRTLRLAPNLPAAWELASLRHVSLGDSRFDLVYRREGSNLVVEARSSSPQVLCLAPQNDGASAACAEPARKTHNVMLHLPAVEVALPHNLPLPGSQTGQLKALEETSAPNQVVITMEAPAGTVSELPVRLNRSGIRISGAQWSGSTLHLVFPSGTGYQRLTLSFQW